VGGYAAVFLPIWEKLEDEGLARLSAAAVRNPAKYPNEMARIQRRNVRVFKGLDEMLAAGRAVIDCVCVPTAIHDHRPMVEAALAAGFDVMVEKPVAAAVQDVQAMIAARDRAGRKTAVGFQSQSGFMMRESKRRIIAGQIGRIRRMTATCLIRRDEAYFSRNAWAGKIKVDGRWGLDGPVMNALAHQLMNMLWLGGTELDACAAPATVQAECLHANPIEADDLSVVRAELTQAGGNNGAQILFVGTYCWDGTPGVELNVHGEKGAIRSDAFTWAELTPKGANAPAETWKGDREQPREDMWRNVVGAFGGDSTGLHVPLETALQHTLAANCAYLSSGGFHAVPSAWVEQKTDEKGVCFRTIKGFSADLSHIVAEGKLPGELGLPWGRPSRKITAAELREFNL
jgi:predicted dehydrogenase